MQFIKHLMIKMASGNTPFLLIFITLLCSFIVNPSLTSSSSCPSFDCGNGLKIGYPFWKQSQESHDYDPHCGYQDFNLSCKNKQPILTLSNYQYKLINLNKSEQTFTLTYAEDHNPNCPVAQHNVNVLANSSPSLLINFTSDDKILHFFYNCSLFPPSLKDIKCLRSSGASAPRRSYAFLDGAIPEFDWGKYCDSTVKAAVINVQSKVGGDDDDLGFVKALLGGFKLKWKADLECQSCEASGGFCGHKANGGSGQKFICFCSDGQHPFHCHDSSGTVYRSYETNYAATGALVFGGLVMASVILYYNVGKMKFQGWLYSRIS